MVRIVHSGGEALAMPVVVLLLTAVGNFNRHRGVYRRPTRPRNVPNTMSSRVLFAFLLALATAVTSRAGEAAAVGPLNVRDFGAIGDGTTLDSPAINRAIEEAAQRGGGTVILPPGTYLSGSIQLRSNLTLRLEAGAVLLAASEKQATFEAPEPNEWSDRGYQDFGHSHWRNSLLWGIGLENVTIEGPGLIHGLGLDCGFDRFADPARGEQPYRANPPGSGNKAIALRDCRNVTLRDFRMLHGGWFAILATGVDNLVIDNLLIDTNRDGMDIDACRNVRVSRCSVNSPWDDGICLKASYALGAVRHCENITISDCFLAGSFDEGSLLDGSFKRSVPAYKSYGCGRIKFGTESNGDFRNIAIANCVFDGSRGLAIESVDGSHIEDVAISNLTMRHVTNAPIFLRLGARLRGPSGTVVGSIRRVSIDHVVASGADGTLGCIVSGIPGHPIEDLRLSHLRLQQQGGGSRELGARVPPEQEKSYPEPGMFGAMPSYGFFFRHVRGAALDGVKLDYVSPEARPAFVLDDVQDFRATTLDATRGTDHAPLFELRDVSDFAVRDVRGLPDTRREGPVQREQL
jgi:polygalacturonase